MPSIGRLAIRRIAAGGVLILLPSLLAGCPSGAATGSTLHITLVDDFTGNIGGGPLGVSGTALDQLVGDLAETGAGTWRGTVDGSTNRNVKTVVMDQECETQIVGTHQIEVTGTRGSFGDSNFQLKFSPKSPPSYTAPDTCDPGPPNKADNGIEWLDFNNQAYLSSMFVTLPDKPGGTWETSQGKGQQPDDPCTLLGPLLGCEWTRTLTVEYRTAGPT